MEMFMKPKNKWRTYTDQYNQTYLVDEATFPNNLICKGFWRKKELKKIVQKHNNRYETTI